MRPTSFSAVLALPALLVCSPIAVLAAEPAPAVAAADEEMGVVKGLEIARPGGGFLGVTTDGVSLVVTFYDKKKKPVKADALRVNARWTDSKLRRAVLLPNDESSFRSPPVLKPPFRYVAFIVLIGADEKEMETYSFNLNSVD